MIAMAEQGYMHGSARRRSKAASHACFLSAHVLPNTYILVRDDFDALNVTRGLEYLLQNLFRNPRVQPTNIKCSFVRLRRRTSHAARADWRSDAAVTTGESLDSILQIGMDGAIVLRDADGKLRRHSLRWWHLRLRAILESRLRSGARHRRLRQRSGRCCQTVCHFAGDEK
jgi:hypothetical protein